MGGRVAVLVMSSLLRVFCMALMDKDLARIFLQAKIGDLQTIFSCSQINLVVTLCGYEFGN